MKTILVRTGMLSVLVVLLCSFAIPSKTRVFIKPPVTNYVYQDGYLFEFNVPANYCGNASGITVESIYDGATTYTYNAKTGYICWDSSAGKFAITLLKVRFYVDNELVEVIMEAQYLENSPAG